MQKESSPYLLRRGVFVIALKWLRVGIVKVSVFREKFNYLGYETFLFLGSLHAALTLSSWILTYSLNHNMILCRTDLMEIVGL